MTDVSIVSCAYFESGSRAGSAAPSVAGAASSRRSVLRKSLLRSASETLSAAPCRLGTAAVGAVGSLSRRTAGAAGRGAGTEAAGCRGLAVGSLRVARGLRSTVSRDALPAESAGCRGVGALLHLDLHTALHAAKTPVLELLVGLEAFADEDVAAAALDDFRIDVRIDFTRTGVPEELLRIERLAVRFLDHDVALGLPKLALVVIDGVVGRQHGIDRSERVILVGGDFHTLAEFAIGLRTQHVAFEERRVEMVRTATVLRHDNRQVFAVFVHQLVVVCRSGAPFALFAGE